MNSSNNCCLGIFCAVDAENESEGSDAAKDPSFSSRQGGAFDPS
jgi:hypothetical protein